MAKFIKLTDARRGDIFALNVDTIEYMMPHADGDTGVVTMTNRTKYTVKETMDDILLAIEKYGTEVKNDDTNRV